MPVACSTSSLTGQEGSIFFQPAGTDFCLLDFTDFPAGTSVLVPANNDYKVGDQIVFTEVGTASLDSALTAGTTYFVVARADTEIEISATAGGTPITLNGDGGVAGSGEILTLDLATLIGGTTYTDGAYADVPLTGGSGTGAIADITVAGGEVTVVTLTEGGQGYVVGDQLSADDADLGGGGGSGFSIDVGTVPPNTDSGDTAANHINIDMADFSVVCQVREFSLDITREELDVTTLPCNTNTLGGKFAAFRTIQAGYATGTGTMTVYFTDDQTTLANRLLGNTLLKNQEGASVKLYVNTVSDGAGGVDDAASLYIESEISITGMSLSVNPDDPTSAELSFTIINPTNVLGQVVG